MRTKLLILIVLLSINGFLFANTKIYNYYRLNAVSLSAWVPIRLITDQFSWGFDIAYEKSLTQNISLKCNFINNIQYSKDSTNFYIPKYYGGVSVGARYYLFGEHIESIFGGAGLGLLIGASEQIPLVFFEIGGKYFFRKVNIFIEPGIICNVLFVSRSDGIFAESDGVNFRLSFGVGF